MNKVAKLVAFSLMTRVIVNEDATEDEIIAAAYAGVQDKINNRELGDNLESIEDDEEMPYGEAKDDIYYQPDFDVPNVADRLNSNQVFSDKTIIERYWPGVKILEFSGDEIEGKEFIDELFLAYLNSK